MAQRQYRISLLDKSFPMLSEQQGRTVIGSSKEEISTKNNKPTVQYCHNVVPTAEGLDSIGYTSVVGSIVSVPPATLPLNDVRTIYGDERARIHLVWDADGAVYALKPGTTDWLSIPATVPATGGVDFSTEELTVGTVNGISYIFYRGVSAFIYEEATDTLVEAPLTGVSMPDVLGVVSSSGYLIAYTKNALAWSSNIDPTDFTPSTITGAGGGNISDIRGPVLFALPNPTGFIIYSDANAVGVTYTGNAFYPFKLREIAESKGGISLDFVAYENNSASQFIYSKAGLQVVTTTKAEAILPEVTDFLAGKRFEDFDETTGLLTTVNVASLKKKIKFVASRYLIISYGVTEFTHAFIYDIALGRIGKLKITHTDCFEYIGEQAEVAKESIAFLLSHGEVKVLDFSVAGAEDGVVILGKLQYTRGRTITLLETEVENVPDGANFSITSRASLDGKNTRDVIGIEAYADTNIRNYVFRNTAVNHALLLQGNFNLVSVVMIYILAGRR